MKKCIDAPPRPAPPGACPHLISFATPLHRSSLLPLADVDADPPGSMGVGGRVE